MNAYDIRPQFIAIERSLADLPTETIQEVEQKRTFIHEYMLAKKDLQNGNSKRMKALLDDLRYAGRNDMTSKVARVYLRVSKSYHTLADGGRAIAKLVRLLFVTLAAIAKLKTALNTAQRVKLEGFNKVAKEWLSKLKINKVPAIGKLVAVAIVILYASFDKELNLAIRNFFNTIASMLLGYPVLSTRQWAEVEEAKKLVAQAKSAAELATHPKRLTGTAMEQKILQHGEADLDYKEKSEKLNAWTRKMQRKAVDIIGDIIFRDDRDKIDPVTMRYLKSIYHGQADWWSHHGTFYYHVSEQMSKDDYFWISQEHKELLEEFTDIGDIAAEIYKLCELLGK